MQQGGMIILFLLWVIAIIIMFVVLYQKRNSETAIQYVFPETVPHVEERVPSQDKTS